MVLASRPYCLAHTIHIRYMARCLCIFHLLLLPVTTLPSAEKSMENI